MKTFSTSAALAAAILQANQEIRVDNELFDVVETSTDPLAITLANGNKAAPKAYTSLAKLKTAKPSYTGQVFNLVAGGRSGPFETLPPGDYSAEIAADPLEGVYVLLNDGQTLKRRLNGYVTPEMFGGGHRDVVADSAPAINSACATLLPVWLIASEYNYSEQLVIGVNSLLGNTSQITKLYYTGDPLLANVSIKITAGTVIRDVKVFGPFSDTQDVSNHLVGLSDASSVGAMGTANRPILFNVRIEKFGTNFYFNDTQNFLSQNVFSQYAKYSEFWFVDTENTWFIANNSNSPMQIGWTPDPDYKLVRLHGVRNFYSFGGIHERAGGIDNAYEMIGGNATFYGTEFNGCDEVVWNVSSGANIVLDRCPFTLNGNKELIVETDNTSNAILYAPAVSGAAGEHYMSLTKGRVFDGKSSNGVDMYSQSPLSNFFGTSGGSGSMVDGLLVAVGSGSAQGVVLTSRGANNTFYKKADDGIASAIFEVGVSSLSGVSKVNVYINKPASPFRRKIGEITSTGISRFLVVPEVDELLSGIGLGIEWDGVTVDPTYGNKGVATIASRNISITRS